MRSRSARVAHDSQSSTTPAQQLAKFHYHSQLHESRKESKDWQQSFARLQPLTTRAMSSDEAEGSSRRSVAVNTFPSEITYRPDWTLRDNRFHRIETQARQPSREWAESSSGWTSVPDTPIFDSNVSLDLNSTLSPPLEYYPRPQSSQYFTQTAADSELQQTPTTTDTASWDDDLSAFHNHSFPSSRPAGDLPFVPASAADQWQQMHRVHPTLPKRTFLPAPQVDPNDPDVSRDNVYNLPTGESRKSAFLEFGVLMTTQTSGPPRILRSSIPALLLTPSLPAFLIPSGRIQILVLRQYPMHLLIAMVGPLE